MTLRVSKRWCSLLVACGIVALFCCSWLLRHNNTGRTYSGAKKWTLDSPTDGPFLRRTDSGAKKSTLDPPTDGPFLRSAQLHLLVQFPVLNISDTIRDEHLVMRQKEFIFCLQQNLLSPHVHKVYIFLEHDQDSTFVKALNLVGDSKLVFHPLGRFWTYKDVIGFASSHLLHKNVMILNADIYVHQGFEHLNETILSSKTMYYLTRHAIQRNGSLCPHEANDGTCHPKSHYIGAHDALLFRLLKPVSSEVLNKIDYRGNLYGVEQVLMFYLTTYEGFKFKNPCKILQTVHRHCTSSGEQSHSRFFQGQRIDHYLKVSHSAPFSDL